MATNTASYNFLLPTVGGDSNLWGGYLNSNFEDLDDLLDGTAPVDGIDIDSGTIDGTDIGLVTPAAAGFTSIDIGTFLIDIGSAAQLEIAATAPNIYIDDTDGTATHRKFGILHTAGGTSFVTLDSTDGLVSTDYTNVRTSSGVSIHQFYSENVQLLEVNPAGIEVAGRIIAEDTIRLVANNLYFEAQQATNNQRVGFRTHDEAGVVRGGFIWDESGTDLLIETYSALGVLRSAYNFYDGSFDLAQADALFDGGFSWEVDGVRIMSVGRTGAAGLKIFDATATLVGQMTSSTATAMGHVGSYNVTTASAANMHVTAAGAFVRSTSSGEFKTDRKSISDNLALIGFSVGDVIDMLHPLSFRSTHEGDESRRFSGFIAEEVAELYPEAAIDNGKNYDVRALVAVLWAEVQSLRKRINSTLVGTA